MSDPRGFEPTERRDEPGEIEPDTAERQPADDQPDSGDYEVPVAGGGEERRSARKRSASG